MLAAIEGEPSVVTDINLFIFSSEELTNPIKASYKSSPRVVSFKDKTVNTSS
jgi:hypothetical protein